MKLMPADIILTMDKKSWFSQAILSVLNFFQKDEVKYQHIMMMVDSEAVIEANVKVEYNFFRERASDFKGYKIIRHRHLNDDQRKEIVDKAKSKAGKNYSYLRLVFQFFDQALHTDWFTKRIKDPDQQICSSLIAWAYHEVLDCEFNGVSWAAVEPDDIDDESLKDEYLWNTIIEWERNKW